MTTSVRRVRDAAVATVLLGLCLPLLGFCALAILWEDGRPILYSQVRHGRRGRSFRIWKFRTMRAVPGTVITAAGDPRITPVGHTLRRWKLDELPQLWNVLRGDMSLVGPRPEVPEMVARVSKAYARLDNLPPGMTDWASLALRNESELLAQQADPDTFYVTRLLPRKLLLARLYRRRRSHVLDLRILLATASAIVGWRRGTAWLAGRQIIARALEGVDD